MFRVEVVGVRRAGSEVGADWVRTGAAVTTELPRGTVSTHCTTSRCVLHRTDKVRHSLALPHRGLLRLGLQAHNQLGWSDQAVLVINVKKGELPTLELSGKVSKIIYVLFV